jgi:cation diffusion facilitator family transporter
MRAQKQAIKTIYLSLAGNVGLALLKGLTGYFGNSYALIADAIESTSDVFASLLVLFGLHYASKPPDENHPYGHGRAEPLITFFVVALLVVSAGIIAYESIINIQTPHELPRPFTLIVLGGIILGKELMYQFVVRSSKKTRSSSLKADAWHHRSDAITSLAAFIGISMALTLGAGYESADDWAALFASAIIVFNAYRIFRPALSEIMDEHLYDHLIEDIRDVAQGVEGIRGTEKCHVRKTGMTFHVDLHARVDAHISVYEGHKIAHRLKDQLQEEMPQLADILIHIEPDGTPR